MSGLNDFLDRMEAEADAELAALRTNRKPASEEKGGFFDAVASGARNVEGSFLDTAASGLGALGFADAAKSLEGSAQKAYEQAQQNLPNPSGGIGELIGQNIPGMATTFGGSGAGAGIGFLVGGPPGAAAGALLGAVAGSYPQLAGGNKQAQRAEYGVVRDEGAALLAAVPQTALDIILTQILPGGKLLPAVGKNIFTKIAVGGAEGALIETPTEIGQQVIQRYQAGQDLTSPEALAEYYEVGKAAGLLGGIVGGVSAPILPGPPEKFSSKNEELERRRQAGRDAAIQDISQTLNPFELFSQKAAPSLLALPAPERGPTSPLSTAKPEPAVQPAPTRERRQVGALPNDLIITKDEMGRGGEAINENLRRVGREEQNFFTRDDLDKLDPDEFNEVVQRIAPKLRLLGDFDLVPNEYKPSTVPKRRVKDQMEIFRRSLAQTKAEVDAARLEAEARAKAEAEAKKTQPISAVGIEAPGTIKPKIIKDVFEKGKPPKDAKSVYRVEQLPVSTGNMWRIMRGDKAVSRPETPQEVAARLQTTREKLPVHLQKAEMPPESLRPRQIPIFYPSEAAAKARAQKGDTVVPLSHGEDFAKVAGKKPDLASWAVVKEEVGPDGSVYSKTPVETFSSQEEADVGLIKYNRSPVTPPSVPFTAEIANPGSVPTPGPVVEGTLKAGEKIEPARARPMAAATSYGTKINPEFKPLIEPMLRELNSVAKKMGLDKLGAKVRLVQFVVGPDGQPNPNLEGVAVGRLINLAVGAHLSANVPEHVMVREIGQVLNHEAIHLMRNLGLFTDQEWGVLRQHVSNLKDKRVTAWNDGSLSFLEVARRKYEDAGLIDPRAFAKSRDKVAQAMAELSEQGVVVDRKSLASKLVEMADDAIYEEAVAEAYRAWADGQRFSGPIEAAFRKIKDLVLAIHRYIAGNGLSASQVFSDVHNGVIATRPAVIRDMDGAKFSVGGGKGKDFSPAGDVTVKVSQVYNVGRDGGNANVGYLLFEDKNGIPVGSAAVGITPTGGVGNSGYIEAVGLRRGPGSLGPRELIKLMDRIAAKFHLVVIHGQAISGAKVFNAAHVGKGLSYAEEQAALRRVARPTRKTLEEIKLTWDDEVQSQAGETVTPIGWKPETDIVVTEDNVLEDTYAGIAVGKLRTVAARLAKLPDYQELPGTMLGPREYGAAMEVQAAYIMANHPAPPDPQNLANLMDSNEADQIALGEIAEDLFKEFVNREMPPDVEAVMKQEFPQTMKALRQGKFDLEYGAIDEFDPRYSVSDKYNPNIDPAAMFSTGSLGQRVRPFTAPNVADISRDLSYTGVMEWVIRQGKRPLYNKVIGKLFGDHVNQEEWAKWVERRVRNTFQKYHDANISIGSYVDLVRKAGGNLVADPYRMTELLPNRMTAEIEDLRNAKFKPLLEAINKSELDPNVVEDFFYVRHAPERNKLVEERTMGQVKDGSGMSTEKAQAIRRDMEKDGTWQRVEKEIAPHYDALVAEIKRIRIKYGLWEHDIDDLFQFYAPLRGHENDEQSEPFRGRFGKSYKISGKEDRSITGRKTPAKHLVANTMLIAEESISRGLRNQVGNAFHKVAQANPEFMASHGITMVERPPMVKILTSDGIVRYVPEMAWKQREDVFLTKVDGKTVGYIIDTSADLRNELLVRALRGNNHEAGGSIIRAMQTLNRFLTRINTGWSPEFIVSNGIKDLGSAHVIAQQYNIPNLTKSIRSNLRSTYGTIWRYDPEKPPTTKMGEYYRELRSAGGLSSWMDTHTLQDQIERLHDEAYDRTGKKTLLDGGKKALVGVKDLVEKANSVVEQSLRLALYASLRDAGVPIDQSAQAALNITVPFSKGGENRTFMNAMYLFFNASLQGNMVLFNAIGRSKTVRKAVMSVMAAGLLQDLFMSAVSDEDEDGISFYDKIPEWKKMTNIIISTGGENYLSLPMPWGLNAFHNLGRSIARAMRTGEAADASWSAIAGFAGAFNPLGGNESLLNFVAPTIMDPIIDLYRNRDWRDKPIIPEQLPWGTAKPNSQLYWNNTSIIFKEFSEILNDVAGGSEFISSGSLTDVSPAHLQYWWDFALGSAGAFVLRVGDLIPTAVGWYQGEEFDWNAIPFMRKVVGIHTSQNDLERFFGITQTLFAIDADMKNAVEEGDFERVKALRQDYGRELLILPQVKRLASARSRIAEQIRKLRESSLPDEYKSVMMKLLRERRDDLVLDANQLYREHVEGE